MGMMLRRGRERALAAERVRKPAKPKNDVTEPEAEPKKPSRLKRAVSSEK